MQWIDDKIAIGSVSDLKHIDLDEFDSIISLVEPKLPDYWIGRHNVILMADGKGNDPKIFEEFLKALDQAWSFGKCTFVHCRMGRSRSVILIALYKYMEQTAPPIKTYPEVLDEISSKIRRAAPNKNLVKDIKKFIESRGGNV